MGSKAWLLGEGTLSTAIRTQHIPPYLMALPHQQLDTQVSGTEPSDGTGGCSPKSCRCCHSLIGQQLIQAAAGSPAASLAACSIHLLRGYGGAGWAKLQVEMEK